MESLSYRKAMHQAFINEILFPHTCISILQDVYKKRLDRMSFTTIFKMIKEMMAKWTDADYSEEITEAINDYMNCE